MAWALARSPVVLGAGQGQVGRAVVGITGGSSRIIARTAGRSAVGAIFERWFSSSRSSADGGKRTTATEVTVEADRRNPQPGQLGHVALEGAFQVSQGHARRRDHLADGIAAGRHSAGIGGQPLQAGGIRHHVVSPGSQDWA